MISADRRFTLDEALALYASVGWTAYTDEPDVLERSLAASHLVLTVRSEGRLVGLARTVSDDATICFVQDILVDPASQRCGFGRQLMRALLERYEHCRQVVLITEADAPAVHAFYRAQGLVPHDEAATTAFIRPSRERM